MIMKFEAGIWGERWKKMNTPFVQPEILYYVAMEAEQISSFSRGWDDDCLQKPIYQGWSFISERKDRSVKKIGKMQGTFRIMSKIREPVKEKSY